MTPMMPSIAAPVVDRGWRLPCQSSVFDSTVPLAQRVTPSTLTCFNPAGISPVASVSGSNGCPSWTGHSISGVPVTEARSECVVPVMSLSVPFTLTL